MTSLVPMRVRAQFAHILLAVLSLAFARSEALAQVVGDFNNDGFADLAIGAPDDNVNDDERAGVVHVLYGSADPGLTSTGSQLWHLDRQNVPEQTEPDDLFGAALAAGDFDGDGIDDLAIGIPGREIGSDEGAGAILVLFGSGAGLTAEDAQYLHQDVSGVLDGAESNDQFGAVLVAGNFDGDGFDDLAIGVPGERGDDGASAGAVNVMYGNNNGLSAGNDQFFQQGSDEIPGDAELNDGFGSALAAGDFDNDGHDDLAVGTPDDGDDDAGVVNILYGSAAGLVGTGSQEWSQDSSGIIDEAEEDDNFGGALAVGDFDFDGFDDLAIGVPGEDGNGLDNVGVVHVLYGSGNGLRSNGSQLWSQDSDGVLDNLSAGDRFGYSLAAGDFDGDTFADLAIGVPGEAVDGNAEAGAVAVLYGAGAGLSAAADEFWHQAVEGILDKPEVDDRFGTVLCAGDFNNNGRADLAVGIPFENVGGADAGAVAVIYGANDGLRAGPDQFWHQNLAGIAEICEPDDHFGGGNAP